MNQPDHFTHSTAAAASARGDHLDAFSQYQQMLKQDPRNSEALYGCCVALRALNRHGPVLSYANQLFQAGFTYTQENRLTEALACFERVIDLGLASTRVYLNCGSLLRRMGQLDAALSYFEKACVLTPQDMPALLIRALTLQELNRHREALVAYQQAIEVEPDNFPANFNGYASHLVLGELTAGWEKFEWRWRNTPQRQFAPDFARLLWTGQQALQDKTIVLFAEHGQGDAIQFCRFAPQLAARGARVVLAVPPSLKLLLTGMAGVSLVVGQDEAMPPYDFHCPLMSVPGALGITLETIPAQLPYLTADPLKVRRWSERMGPRRGRLRVGLAWAGEARPGPDEFAMNLRRSMHFEQLAPLFEVPGIEFFSVQKGSDAQSQLRQSPLHSRLADFSAGFSDFAETAALLDNLDLLITVDTAVAHLAGALGKPVWLMNRFDTCWRWLLERTDSPWYPGVMRIFRQPRAGDWDAVLLDVKQALLALSA